MNVLDRLLALERQVWDALVTGDMAADRALLSSDFLGVYKTGMADRDAHCMQLADGPTVATYEIENARVIALSEDTVLLAYMARYTRPSAPKVEEAMYVSSIWQRRHGDWLNIFSQDTDLVRLGSRDMHALDL